MSETAEERDKRIIEMLAASRHAAIYGKGWDDSIEATKSVARESARWQLARIRAAGGDVTVPDLPEPTYTVTLTNDEWHLLRYLTNKIRNGMAFSKTDRESTETLHMRICRIDPDPVTS